MTNRRTRFESPRKKLQSASHSFVLQNTNVVQSRADTRALLRLERTMNLLCHQREGGREGREGGERRGAEGMGSEGRGEGGRGGMTVIHILMAPQYLNSNHVTYYVIT